MSIKMLRNFKIKIYKFKTIAVSKYIDTCICYLNHNRLVSKFICNLWYPKLVYLTKP